MPLLRTTLYDRERCVYKYVSKQTDREMLEEPGSHDVGGDLGKDAAFLLPLSGAICLRVFVGRHVTRPDTVVQSVTCQHSTHVSNIYDYVTQSNKYTRELRRGGRP